jgi:hypothetical protein
MPIGLLHYEVTVLIRPIVEKGEFAALGAQPDVGPVLDQRSPREKCLSEVTVMCAAVAPDEGSYYRE